MRSSAAARARTSSRGSARTRSSAVSPASADDLIPFGMAIGNRGRLAGVNIVGMRRRGFTNDDIQNVRRAYKALFAEEGTLRERVNQVAQEFSDSAPVQMIVAFLREGGDRNVVTPRERRDENA